MNKYKKPIIIGEQGCSSLGNIKNAKELIDIAAECGCDYVKFQKRNPKESLPEDQWHKPHPNPYYSYGKDYLSHRVYLEYSISQHAQLKSYAEKKRISYSSSVWDVTSAMEVSSLNPSFIKVPSASNNNLGILEHLRDKYCGIVVVSLGMTSKEEEENILDIFKKQSKDRLVLMACTSGYPVEFKDVCLLEIKRIKEMYGDKIKSIGYSNHSKGIAIPVAAYTLGAEWIEVHYIDDRTKRHTDAATSLEPQGLRKLIRDLNAAYAALTYKNREILEVEKVQRLKLKHKGN